MPTKQLSILLKILASLVVRRSQILTPSGRKTASHFSTAAENTGICRRSRPMPGHWEPIPEKTYQSGSFTLSVFWKQSFICDVDLRCNLYKQHIYLPVYVCTLTARAVQLCVWTGFYTDLWKWITLLLKYGIGYVSFYIICTYFY